MVYSFRSQPYHLHEQVILWVSLVPRESREQRGSKIDLREHPNSQTEVVVLRSIDDLQVQGHLLVHVETLKKTV